MIDRIVFERDRAVAALVFHVELKIQHDFLAGLDAVPDRLAVLQSDAAALVQCEFGIDQIAMVLEQPLDPQRVTVKDFLVGLERQDDVAIGPVAFLLVANEIGDKGRRHVFVVARAAGIEIAVLLRQLERLARPVLAAGRHDVEMRHQQDRLARAGAAQPGDQIALARRRLEYVDVGVRKTGSLETRRHRLRRTRGVAGRGHGVDLDKLLVDVEGKLLLRAQSLRAAGACHHGQRRDRGDEESEPKTLPRCTASRPDFSKHTALPNAGPPGGIQTANSFAGKLSAQTLLRLSHPYLLSFAAITSISTRNPGLASDATPTTDRAGRLG